jgi:phosphoglycerate dehydrogenase-like enzyme
MVTGQLDVEVATAADAPSLEELARGATVAIADYSGQNRIAGSVVDALAPTCQLVQVPAAGTDSVDVDACRAAGIPVASCAGLNDAAVAEWCVWGAIDALRQATWASHALRDGRWEQIGHARYELAGKTVGIVGLGRIGSAAAERFRAFGVDLAYWTLHRRSAEEESRRGVRWLDLDDLIPAADVLVLACALTDDTRGLLSAERIAAMKPSAVVVNAARGEVTDEAALAQALDEGRLLGAAVDAFAVEPLPEDHPLRGAASAVLTPHLAGATVESVGRILIRTLDNVRAALTGGTIEGLL